MFYDTLFNKRYLFIFCVFFSVFSLQGSPPLPHLDFGLCARVSPAVFLSPRSHFPLGQRFPISNHVTSGFMSPRSLFTQWSAVSHFKPRDFRLYEPTIPFYPLVSGFPHRKFLWSRDRSRPIRSQEICYLGPLYYYSPFID